MAVATSPYQQNDYQAVSTYRPFNLPTSEIFKGLQASNEFWEQGARRVKSAYEGALNLKLSLEPNKKIRDQFMADAEKEITKISSMNLADPEVQRQGINIFKPLLRDEGIVSDDYATRTIERINSDALSWRDRENGKFYSSTNHKYALFGAKEFKNSTDRMAGKKYMQEAKEFEPFYDPTSELNTILKHCKPDKASGESIQGMYNRGFSNESLTAAKINSCLDGGLSDKAKRQLQINGAVTYKENPEALRDKYIPHLQGTRSSLSQEKAALEGVLANVNNLKNLKPAELQKLGFKDASEITPDVIQRMREMVRNHDSRIINLNQNISKLQSGDLRDITGSNFETVASTVFSRDYMQNVAEGFSYDFTTNTVKGDPVEMLIFKEAKQNARQEDDQSHDIFMKQQEMDFDREMKILDALKTGKGKDKLSQLGLNEMTAEDWELARSFSVAGDPLSPSNTTDSYDEITVKRQEIAQKRSGLNQQFDMEIGNPYKFGSEEARAFRENYILSGQSDPVKKQIIDRVLYQMDNYVILEDIYKGIQQSVDEKIAPIKQDVERKRLELSNLGSLNVQLTGSGGKKIQLNKSLAEIATDVQSGKASIQRHGFGGTLELTYGDFKVPIYNDSSGKRDKLIKVFDYVQENKNIISTIKNKRNELTKQETIIQRETYTLPQLNDEKTGFKQTLLQGKNLPADMGGKIVVGNIDAMGSVVVTVMPPGKNDTYNLEDVTNELLKHGAKNNRRVEGRDDQVVLTEIDAITLINQNNMSEMMAPYVRTLENLAKPTKASSTGYIRSGHGGSFRMEILPMHNGGFTYKILKQGKETSPVAVYTDRQTALMDFNKVLDRNQPKVEIPK